MAALLYMALSEFATRSLSRAMEITISWRFGSHPFSFEMVSSGVYGHISSVIVVTLGHSERVGRIWEARLLLPEHPSVNVRSCLLHRERKILRWSG